VGVIAWQQMLHQLSEQQSIESPIDTAEPPGVEANCTGILYVDDDNWTFWMDGREITSNTHDSEFDVISVSVDQVEVVPRNKVYKNIPNSCTLKVQ
jgi:hypothetical protein